MGFFRIFFALMVFWDHLGLSASENSWFIINGIQAVASFFIISGFYMGLILNEKYINKNKSYFLFMSNRILRIYPMYWLMLIVASFIYIPHLSPRTLQDSALDVCKQIFIFCDFKAYFSDSGWRGFLFVSAGWTIGLEMIFYALAPFLVITERRILFFFLISVIVKFSGNHSLLAQNLIFFALGSVSYLIYKRMRERKFHKEKLAKYYLIFVLLLIFIPYTFILTKLVLSPQIQAISSLFYYLSFASIIPILFLMFSKNKIDAAIGEFSYPLYICHVVILHALYKIYLTTGSHRLYVITSVVIVFFVSYLLLKFIDIPIQSFRASRVKSVGKKN